MTFYLSQFYKTTRSSDSKKITLAADEELDVWIYTRSAAGANFHILDENKREMTPVQLVQHKTEIAEEGKDGMSTRVHLTVTGKVSGPGTFKVKGVSTSSMFSSYEVFLVVCNVGKKN